MIKKFAKPFLLNTKGIFTSFLLILFTITCFAQTSSNVSGWYLTDYSFKDGSKQTGTAVAGKTTGVNDVINYKGNKGNIEITHNRSDAKSGQLLAGITYRVSWTDPPAVLIPNEFVSFDFGVNTVNSLTWKVPQQMMSFNQGMGINFITPDGIKYINKDTRAKMTLEKAIVKGTKGTKRVITMYFGNGFSANYNYEWREGIAQEAPVVVENTGNNAWYYTGYSFIDGSKKTATAVAGKTSGVNDVINYKGNKGDIEISHNRFDAKSGQLLAGITYSVSWTDPPTVLNPSEYVSFDFGVSTIKSLTWKVPQQMFTFNQGMGINFITPDGIKYINKDIHAKMTLEKVVDKGTKGAKRVIKMYFGNGFSANYNYEWRD